MNCPCAKVLPCGKTLVRRTCSGALALATLTGRDFFVNERQQNPCNRNSYRGFAV